MPRLPPRHHVRNRGRVTPRTDYRPEVDRLRRVVLPERRACLLRRLRAPPAYAAQTCARQQAGRGKYHPFSEAAASCHPEVPCV